MNHFLPIDGLLVSHEHIRPTANVALILSKATLEQHPELMEDFSLSKNGYFLTKAVIPAGLFSLAWDIRNNCCLSTKLWDVPDSTPAMSAPDEPYLRFYSQLYCEVLRLVGKGHDKFKIETRRLAFKNIKIREIEAWRNEAEEKLDRHQLHGMSKIHTETWLNFLSLDDDWKDEATNMRRLKKRSLSETTEEEGDDLIDVDDDDDMEVDADIPAGDDDDVQVISKTLDEAMVDDLAEARQKGTWVKKGTVKKEESDMPDDPSAAASSSSAVKKEEAQGTRVWSSRARSRTPSRTVLKKADHAPGTARTPSEGRRVSFSDIPGTKFFEAQPKKRATSRAREVISDARKAQKTPDKYFHRPEKMTCLTCSSADVLFFCRACSHGTCLDCYHEASNHCSCNSIYLCSTVPDADIPAPLGEHEREEVTAEIDFAIPFAAESEGWHPDDRYAGRLHRLQEIKDLVLGGGSTGYAAMDRVVLEGASKYHYTNHPTYKSRNIPSIAQHWDEQSDVAPYPIIRPSCYYDSNRRYTGEEMRQIVELSRSYMQGYRANQGEFDLDEARLLRSTEHVSVLLLNFGDINRTPHFNGRQPLSRELAETDQYAVLRHYLVRNTAHITILLEANGIERHRELFNQYQCLCVMAMADGESPAAVCSTDILGSSRLELIRRIELEGDRLAWVARAATFRVIWGKVDESTDGGITDDRGVRKNLRVALEEGADPADNMEVIVCPDSLAVAQASTTYIEAEPVDAEALFHECPTFRTGSLNDCKRICTCLNFESALSISMPMLFSQVLWPVRTPL